VRISTTSDKAQNPVTLFTKNALGEARRAASRGIPLFGGFNRKVMTRSGGNDATRSFFRRRASRYFHVLFCLAAAAFAAVPDSQASELNLPPKAVEAIHLMYSGKPDEAIALARQIESATPDHPLGYLIEANVLYWKIYCKRMERKWNTYDAWSYTRPADSDDEAELALADKVTHLAEAKIAKSDSAEMELYAGLGSASRARVLSLRYVKIPVVHAGVEARRHLLRSLELNPNMVDAYLGLGLYNYYVDTLSGLAKVLRFFMGIPGGDKHEGLRQLEVDSARGEQTQVEARYNMAKSLRNYDLDYKRADEAAEPLLTAYPQNAVFLLLVADLEQKLGNKAGAAAKYHAAETVPNEDAACADHLRNLAREGLASLNLKGE